MGLTSVLLLIGCFAASVQGHGYLMEPPGRASAWRFGFDTPVDYNDNECFCGGFNYQYQEMGGKCGICGDAWDADPRPHEVGDLYATGTLVRNYTRGQIIPVTANVTANHLGHFEYKICANNDVSVEATQECLDLIPLYGVGHEEWFLYIGDATGAISHELQLPADLECSQCVVQLFRHGSRAPVMGYPGDPNNNETFWWAGYGQLTEEGLRQHYALGRWFRHRYNGVLPPRFDSKKLVARSTDVDRTLNSAEANLAGIFGDYYDSHPKQQFREGLPWRPTPIHTVPGSLDTLLAVGAACPELLRLEKQLLQEPFVVNYTRRLKPLMRTLTARLRVNFSSIVDVGMAYDNFNIQRSYKLPLPGRVLPLMPQLEEVQRFSFFLLAPTPALKKLRAGPLLAKILEDFHEKQTLQTPDFLMYSAHDTNVAEMLQAFDMYTDVKPPFASALLFELHHMHNDFFVRLYYHNDTSRMSSLHPLTLRGCNFTCSLADFETLLDPVILRDFESQCQRQSDEQIGKLPQLMTETGRPSAALFENANGALMNTTLQN